MAPAGCLDMPCVEVVKDTDIQEELSPPSSCVGVEMSVTIAILTRAVPRSRTLFPAAQHPGEQVSVPPATAQEPQAVCALKVSVFRTASFSARGSSAIGKLIHRIQCIALCNFYSV